MDLRAAFRARLRGNSTLNAAASGRIEWGGLPQNAALPYVRLTQVGPGREWTHDGPDDLVSPRVQIDIFGKDTAQAATIANLVQAEMERVDAPEFGGWRFEPPATLEGDRGPDVQSLAGGGQTSTITHDYTFWARPA